MRNPLNSQNLYCIDGNDLGLQERTGTYVLDERPVGMVTLIETGPSISIPYIKEGLTKLSIQLDEINYIIVTHIHLDHAGGAGLLLKDCPNAKVIVHPRGKRHLHNPERLVQGAKTIYKEKFDKLFDPVIPIPLERLLEMEDRATLRLSDQRLLTFYDTPGHAKHHFSIHDGRTNTFFTGDTCGIRYPAIDRAGITFYLPSTSPNQFNPEDMLASIQLIKDLNPEQIAFGHFGLSNDTKGIFDQLETWLPLFMKKGTEIHETGGNWEQLRDTLNLLIMNVLTSRGIKDTHELMELINLDVTISAMGVMDYLEKNY
ncbi:MAG: MBL fold metallo-hydrolase [Bacillus sp. (in: Bacteria)]|nr:MBL fold metallo-hydrolase [Bacillus sp. (in: firmicutes)]